MKGKKKWLTAALLATLTVLGVVRPDLVPMLAPVVAEQLGGV